MDANKPTGGPLSRTWPQLFKKRRRHSPVREAVTENALAQAAAPPLQKIPIPKSSNASVFSESTVSSGNSQAEALASKSNYEWIAEGRHAEMGLHFSTAMATGVMMKRATHRAAEQARRDRMKTAMVDLAEFLLDGEVTFGSGTTCFVVMKNGEGEQEETTEDSKRRTTINKARLIEMALERLKAQEKEIDILTEKMKDCQCRMDTE